MAYNFTIVGSSLVVIDTDDGAVKFDAPITDCYFNNTDLNNNKVRIYDTSGIGAEIANEFGCEMAEAQIDGLAASRDLVRDFGRNKLANAPLKIDSSNLDSFSRLPVADPGERLDVEFIYNKQNDIFDEITAGAGTVTHNTSSRDLTLANNGDTAGDSAEMLSYPVPYTPGNSQDIAITGVLNEADLSGGDIEVFLRSSVTGSVVEQVFSLNAGEFNGSDISDVDFTKSQIFEISFQSLKVGAINFFLDRGGQRVKVHTITNDNKRKSGYWQHPSLPCGWRIYNDATYTYCEAVYGDDNNGIGYRFKVSKNAAAQMRAICCTVKSGGGDDIQDIPGFSRVADMGVTSKTVSSTIIPLISIRPKSTFKGFDNYGLYLPKSFTVEVNNPVRLIMYHDGTLTDEVWADVDADESGMEYDVTATAIADGHILFSDYLGAGKNTAVSAEGLLDRALLWNRQNGGTGIFTLAAVKSTATDADALAGVRWREIR